MSTGLYCAECGYSGFTEEVVGGLGKCPRCGSWIAVYQPQEAPPGDTKAKREGSTLRWSLAILLGLLPFGSLVLYLWWNEHLGARDTIIASVIVLLVMAGIRYGKYEPVGPAQLRALASTLSLLIVTSLGVAIYFNGLPWRGSAGSPADALNVTFTPVLPHSGKEISGTVHNGGPKTVEGVSVTFRLLDDRGRIIGEEHAFISSIPKGRDWDFTCHYSDDRVASVQLASVNALGWGKP